MGQLGNDGVGDLALGARIRKPGRERPQHAHLREHAVAGARRDGTGRLVETGLGGCTGSDKLGCPQLVWPEVARGAGAADEVGDHPRSRSERRDDEGVAPVPGLGCLPVDFPDNRREPRLADPGGSLCARPARSHDAARRPRSDDPRRIEPEELAEETARRIIPKRGQDGDAAAGMCRRLDARGAARRGRPVTASEPWEHDSQEVRPLLYGVASPERGNHARVT